MKTLILEALTLTLTLEQLIVYRAHNREVSYSEIASANRRWLPIHDGRQSKIDVSHLVPHFYATLCGTYAKNS